MRSTILVSLTALALVVTGCEKKNEPMNDKASSGESSAPAIGGGPSGAGHNDPATGSESLSGGGAKTGSGATGPAITDKAGGDNTESTANDPTSGPESLSGGGAKTGAGATGPSPAKGGDGGTK